MITIDPELVERIFIKCIHNGDLYVDGILGSVKFNKIELESNNSIIKEMLNLLPDDFHVFKGGGQSFLNACVDKNGVHWTGLHQTMAHLFELGMGIGVVVYLMPKSMWSSLPGGMPYLCIDIKQD